MSSSRLRRSERGLLSDSVAVVRQSLLYHHIVQAQRATRKGFRCARMNVWRGSSAFVLLPHDWRGLEIRVSIAYGAYLLQKRRNVENRGLVLPATYDLYADRHPIMTRAEPHGNTWQAGHAQRRCRGHDAHDVYSLAVDQQLRLAVPEGRRRQYRSEQDIVLLEVLGVTILQPLHSLRCIDVVRRWSVGQREHEPGHVANFILAAPNRRLHESGLHLEDMQTAPHIEGKIALECRDAHGLDSVSEILERCRGSLHGRRGLAVDRPKAGLHQPAHTKRTLVGTSNATIERDGAAGIAVLSVWSSELRKGQRQIANAPRHRSHMPEATGLPRPDAGHRDSSVCCLQRDNTGVGCRPTERNRKIGTEAKR